MPKFRRVKAKAVIGPQTQVHHDYVFALESCCKIYILKIVGKIIHYKLQWKFNKSQ